MYIFCHHSLWESGIICGTFNWFFLILLPGADATTGTCFWFNCDPQDKGFYKALPRLRVPVSALMNCFRDDRRHCGKTCQSLFLQSCHNFDLIWMRPEQARTAEACTGPEGKVKPPTGGNFSDLMLVQDKQSIRASYGVASYRASLSLTPDWSNLQSCERKVCWNSGPGTLTKSRTPIRGLD